MRVEWTGALFGSLAYLVVGNSLVAISLLLAMLRHGSLCARRLPWCPLLRRDRLCRAGRGNPGAGLAGHGAGGAGYPAGDAGAAGGPPGSTATSGGQQNGRLRAAPPTSSPMNAVITAALPVFALILTGWLAARWNLLGSGATDALNRCGLSVAAGAAVPRHDPGRSGRHDALGLRRRLRRRHRHHLVAGFAGRRAARARALTDRSIEGLAAAYANAGYMGIPLCVPCSAPKAWRRRRLPRC